MKPPILVFGDDLDVFDSVEAAERYLELQDIANCIAYDSEGFRLGLRTEYRRRFVFHGEAVKVFEQMPSMKVSDELRARLIQYVDSIAHLSGGATDCDLRELVSKAHKWARCE